MAHFKPQWRLNQTVHYGHLYLYIRRQEAGNILLNISTSGKRTSLNLRVMLNINAHARLLVY